LFLFFKIHFRHINIFFYIYKIIQPHSIAWHRSSFIIKLIFLRLISFNFKGILKFLFRQPLQLKMGCGFLWFPYKTESPKSVSIFVHPTVVFLPSRAPFWFYGFNALVILFNISLCCNLILGKTTEDLLKVRKQKFKHLDW